MELHNKTEKNRLRKYILRMLIYFGVDLCIGALIVFGYYWFTFKAPKKATEPQQILTFPDSGNASAATSAQAASATQATSAWSDTAAVVDISSSPEAASPGSSEILPVESSSEAPVTDATTEPLPETTVDRDSLSWREKFADKFTAEAVLTANSYSDQNISVTYIPYTVGTGDNTITYYVADIYVADIRYFGSGIYNDDGTFQNIITPQRYAAANPNFVLFTNGDYCGYNTSGVIVRNGRLYRDADTYSDQCVLFADGTMKIYPKHTFTSEIATTAGVWQSWCFGPSLLNEDGSAISEFPNEDYLNRLHPRTALGYFEPGHYCLVVIDGRETGYSRGMTLPEMSVMFRDLGCRVAYNLDGGASSCMMFAGQAVNHLAGRNISDFVVLSNTPLV